MTQHWNNHEGLYLLNTASSMVPYYLLNKVQIPLPDIQPVGHPSYPQIFSLQTSLHLFSNNPSLVS